MLLKMQRNKKHEVYINRKILLRLERIGVYKKCMNIYLKSCKKYKSRVSVYTYTCMSWKFIANIINIAKKNLRQKEHSQNSDNKSQ